MFPERQFVAMVRETICRYGAEETICCYGARETICRYDEGEIIFRCGAAETICRYGVGKKLVCRQVPCLMQFLIQNAV